MESIEGLATNHKIYNIQQLRLCLRQGQQGLDTSGQGGSATGTQHCPFSFDKKITRTDIRASSSKSDDDESEDDES